MKMTDDRMEKTFDEAGLEAVFAAARATPTPASEALMARVLADADALMPQPLRPARPQERARTLSIWGMLSQVFAGPAPVAGLVVATLAGLWFGFVVPLETDFGLGLSVSAQTLDFYPSGIEDWTEILDIDSLQED